MAAKLLYHLVPLLPHMTHPSVSKMEDTTMTAAHSREPLHVKMGIPSRWGSHALGPNLPTHTLALVKLLILN